MYETSQSHSEKSWPDYRAVWRWHFYASLFCMPFVIVLSVSGAIYLFKPQIEAWNDRPFDQLKIVGPAESAALQIKAALDTESGATFSAYELPQTEHQAARVVVRRDGEAIRVFVHPQSLKVLHAFPEDQRFMRWMFRLHGELLMGERGSMIVELAASWTIIMIVTGLYLWWPRNTRKFGGVLYPRLGGGSRMFWRDIHSVTGVWISSLALLLLISGLPWAKSWGNYFKMVRRVTGTAVARQDWVNESERKIPRRDRAEAGEHSGHSSGGKDVAQHATTSDLTAVDRVVAAVQPLGLAHPVLISPPRGDSFKWSVKSNAANRPLRENLSVDGRTGEILSRDGFWDRHWIDRVVAVGIAAHEGQLFGWPNQALGLLTTIGLVLLCVSGTILWWRRRDQGVLGAPKIKVNPRVSLTLFGLVLIFGLYLPLFGTSLVLVLLFERLVIRRFHRISHWLGLSAPTPRMEGK